MPNASPSAVPPPDPSGPDPSGRDPFRPAAAPTAAGVQPFGCLLVVSTGWVVCNVSANSADILGLPPERLVGARLLDLLPAEAMHSLRGKVQTMGPGDEGGRLFGLDLFGDGRLFDAALHRDGGVLLFEFEPRRELRLHDDHSLAQSLLARVRRAEGVEAMCAVLANGIWAMTGFDRVMVCRFEPDMSARVIAEALGAGSDSRLGQRFPAADMPPQNKVLHERSMLRIVPDVDAPPVPLVPPHGPTGEPVDLSLAVTRAVTPARLDALRAQGVGAWMAVSILREGRLWGIVSCHHPRPHHIDCHIRSAIELFTQLVSYELALAAEAEAHAAAEAGEALGARLAALGPDALGPGCDAARLQAMIAEVIAIDGLVLAAGDEPRRAGLAPEPGECARLCGHLARTGGRLFASDCLERDCPGAVAPARGIAGLLAIPLRGTPPGHLLLLRREQPPERIPAGMTRSAPLRPVPRADRRAASWSAADRRAAESLRVALLELALAQADEAVRQASRLSQHQEVLLAELAHRLRNAFGLASGIVARSSEGQDEALRRFADGVIDRIAALARTSDGLAADPEARPLTLRRLIAAEAEAFGGGGSRIAVNGGDGAIASAARSTLTLVVHELVTNSVKHGALGTADGTVEVSLGPMADGGFALDWIERGGPRRKAPRRTGFGSALLAHAIPHELGGTARVDHRPGGLEARFTLPPGAVEPLPDMGAGVADHGSAVPDTAADPGIPLAAALLDGAALVVEDNLLIALNAADSLRAMGAGEVVIAATATEALERIAVQGFAFAIIDLDLGGTSSAPVAEALAAAGVPFLLASGYVGGSLRAEGGEQPAALRDAPRLAKPYSNEAVAEAALRHGLLPRRPDR